MGDILASIALSMLRVCLSALVVGVPLVLLACTSASQGTPAPAPPVSSATAPATPPVSPEPGQIRLLKTSPEVGPVGTPFTLSGEGLPPGKGVEFQWATVNGSFAVKASTSAVKYEQRRFAPKRVPLGRAVTDAQGRVTATFNAPEDYGEVHEIYGVVDGRDMAKGGFRILRTATISPTEGPVGTPITITVKGLGWKPFEHSMGVLYDNKYTGFISAVTSRGSAVFQVRAAGPPGKHAVRLNSAGKAVPYINIQQSPFSYLPQFNFLFTVTKDAGPPPDRVDGPEGQRAASANAAVPGITDGRAVAMPGVQAVLEPASGPVLSQSTLRARGLPPNADVELLWATVKDNATTSTGRTLHTPSLMKATAAQDGSLVASVPIPDDLGGWHAVRLVTDKETLADAPYYVERSLVSVTPKRVKTGETFTIKIKGAGWTDLDNAVAVTYDNAYIGYASSQGNSGDITIALPATGGPGTHLLDLYPLIYTGRDKTWWGYRLPFLTFARDFPGIELGYRLSTFRLAIQVVE